MCQNVNEVARNMGKENFVATDGKKERTLSSNKHMANRKTVSYTHLDVYKRQL